jgi:hypothetical protein
VAALLRPEAAMTRRGLVTLVAALGSAAARAPRAQDGSALVGRWEGVRRDLGHVLVLRPDGTYTQRRLSAPGAAPEVVGEESGTYAVQGSRLVLRPAQGAQRVLRWRIGRDHPTILPGERGLFLAAPDGTIDLLYSSP